MSFRPLHDRVLARRLDADEKTAGGIIIPDSAKEKPQEGEVVAVGPGALSEKGETVPMNVKKGDRIGIAARNSANWIILDMAITMAGGICTKLNGWWQGDELADGIEDVSCSIVFADAQRAARLAESGRKHGAERYVRKL